MPMFLLAKEFRSKIDVIVGLAYVQISRFRVGLFPNLCSLFGMENVNKIWLE